MSYGKILDVQNFAGIDNVTDPSKLIYDPKTGRIYLRTAVNIDINDDHRIQRAVGIDSIQPGSFHSLWSSLDQSFGFCIQSSTLYYTTFTGSAIIINPVKTNLSVGSPMVYTEAGNRVFMTNGFWIGYFEDGVIYDLSDPGQEFKTKLPAGHLIEFYNNQIYVAVDRVIFFSDSAAWGRTDLRKNFIPFPSRIRMIQAVDDGLFISDSNEISYLKGDTGLELNFNFKLDTPVFTGGFKKIAGKMVGGEVPLEGDVVVMLTAKGIYLGSAGGQFTDMTGGKYIPTDMHDVNGLIRVDPDKHQIIFIGVL
jgi:hypothetical protein